MHLHSGSNFQAAILVYRSVLHVYRLWSAIIDANRFDLRTLGPWNAERCVQNARSKRVLEKRIREMYLCYMYVLNRVIVMCKKPLSTLSDTRKKDWWLSIWKDWWHSICFQQHGSIVCLAASCLWQGQVSHLKRERRNKNISNPFFPFPKKGFGAPKDCMSEIGKTRSALHRSIKKVYVRTTCV